MKIRVALPLLAPALALWIVLFAAPMVMVGRLSLWNGNLVAHVNVGLRNYVEALRDSMFLKSFVNAGILVLLIVPARTIFSYRTASMLTGYGEGTRSIMRFVLYLPTLASGLIMGLIWRWILAKDGLLNGALAIAGIEAIPWLFEAWPARFSVAMVMLACGVGGDVIVFSMFMASIPVELKDQALVDGCTERQYRKRIMFPLMVPFILLVVLLSVSGTMQIWETIYVLAPEGGPEGSIATPVYEIFQTAFMFGRQGYAAAKGLMLVAVIALLLFTKKRLEKTMKL